MSCEDGKLRKPHIEVEPHAKVEPHTQVDVHRAFREMQRWLNIDDQTRPYGNPSLPSNWKDTAELIATAEIDPITRETIWRRPNGRLMGDPNPPETPDSE